MDPEVLEFDIGLGGGGSSARDGDDDANIGLDVDEDMADSPAPSILASNSNGGGFGGGGSEIYLPEGDQMDLEPYEGMEFESEEAAKAFYNSYARRVGFSTRVSSSRRSRRDGAIIQRQFVCAKEGFRNLNEKRTKDREIKRPRTITRVGCKASLSVKMQDSGKWVVSGFVREHNHELVPPDQVHCLRSHRQISGPAKTLIDTLQAAGMGPRRIMSALIKEYGGISKVGFTEVDCRNYMRNNRQRSLEGDIQLLLDYLRQMQAENPNFFYAVQGDEDQALMSNVFWADPKSRMNYTYFGDTVIFDTTYRTNRYRVPFASFTGLNHHGQPVLFGCALILNESESSFVWLLQSWLHAMSDHHPISITTDPDRLIQMAVAQILPETRLRFNKSSIFKETQEKLAQLYQSHPTFETEFGKCINETETIHEFESSWVLLLERYFVMDNEWLQSMHNARQQWVPVYMRDTFFGELSVSEGSGGLNSFFEGFVNPSTTIQMLIKQYEKAVATWHEKELKADYDTSNTTPVLKTPSPMEKQAANLFTRRIFMKFQEELVETLANPATKIDDSGTVTTYRVAKFGEDHKAHTVSFNSLEMKACCSCQMFENSGIICRHILAVFRAKNVLTLPSQYVLKRWTRNAKSGAVLEERASELPNNSRESLTVRYNSLRQEAIKYVEEGAKSIHIYTVAMDALQEAVKKVAAAKNQSPAAAEDGALSNGDNQELHAAGDTQAVACQSADEKEKKIRELTMELESTNQRCEVYRANLLAVLRDMEEQKLKLSVKVQNARLSLKE